MFRSKFKRLSAVVLTLAMAIGLVGTAGAGSTPGVTETEIVVGSFQALSGPYAAIGVPMKSGMEAYFNWINKNGGINGRKIKLIVEDDQLNPSRTVAAVKKMVEQDNIFALVGGLGTYGCLAVMDYVVEKGVPFVYQGSGASALAYPPKKNIFAVQPNYTNEGKIIAQFVVDQLKAQRIAVLYENTDIGKEGLAGVKSQLEKLGKSQLLVLEVGFAGNEVNFSPYVLKAMQAKADVVILYTLAKGAAAIAKEAYNLGYKPTFVTTYPNADPSLFAAAGPAWEGVIMAGWVPILAPDDQDFKKCIEIYQQSFPNEIPNPYAVAGFIAAEVFTEGVRRAGKNLTRESLISALETLKNWDGIMAKDINYGPNERSGKISMYFLKAEKGQFKTITGWVTPK